MNIHEKYISRCIELGKLGIGNTYPNPSVGCCLVVDDKIIGEGYTSIAGGNHAEVNAINSNLRLPPIQVKHLYIQDYGQGQDTPTILERLHSGSVLLLLH